MGERFYHPKIKGWLYKTEKHQFKLDNTIYNAVGILDMYYIDYDEEVEIRMRTNVPEADEVLDLYFPVLDHGFVALKDYMGTDDDIESAARVSYAKGTRKISDTANLIRYLFRHQHHSPLEMVSLKFHLRMPLYVIQQLLRHRTAKINQESFRYSEVPDLVQRTGTDEWRLQSKDNKQGSSGKLEVWPEGWTTQFVQYMDGYPVQPQWIVTSPDGQRTVYFNEPSPSDYLSKNEDLFLQQSKGQYKQRIDFGVAKEQARKDIPVSTYSSLYWKMDLRNLLHFLRLRTDSHAQLEIRAFANVIAGIVQRVCPISYQAWVDYAYCAQSFTRLDMLMLGWCTEQLSHCPIEEWEYNYICMHAHKHEEMGMGKRELDEFWKKLIPVTPPDFKLDLSTALTKV